MLTKPFKITNEKPCESESVDIKRGIKQGCLLRAFLFDLCIDRIFDHMRNKSKEDSYTYS
jgi:hypothetical protein